MPDTATKADLRGVESRMTMRLALIAAAGVGILAAVIKLV